MLRREVVRAHKTRKCLMDIDTRILDLGHITMEELIHKAKPLK